MNTLTLTVALQNENERISDVKFYEISNWQDFRPKEPLKFLETLYKKERNRKGCKNRFEKNIETFGI
jgi:hypothetical protein